MPLTANMYPHMKVISWISIPLSERQCHLLRSWLEILLKDGDIRRNKQEWEEICSATKRNTGGERKESYSSDTDRSSSSHPLYILQKVATQ